MIDLLDKCVVLYTTLAQTRGTTNVMSIATAFGGKSDIVQGGLKESGTAATECEGQSLPIRKPHWPCPGRHNMVM